MSETQPHRWQWNEHEETALHELQCHSAAILYLRGLRKHMNYKTGIVGGKERRVSYRMFIEVLEERRNRGSKLPNHIPSLAEVRWALERLEQSGLIEKVPQPKRTSSMVFRLPLATIGIKLDDEQHHQQQASTAKDFDKNESKNSQIEFDSNKEEQQKQQQTAIDSQPIAENKIPACPHKQILKLWREVMPSQIRMPRDSLWMPERAAYRDLASRWKKCFDITHSKTGKPLYHDNESGLIWWRGFFVYCTQSKFLMEECRPFELPWVVKRENFIKIQEGKYHDGK